MCACLCVCGGGWITCNRIRTWICTYGTYIRTYEHCILDGLNVYRVLFFTKSKLKILFLLL